eukprot:Seg1048.16 transcript_id=Seg1048.16/GoldUCD/mRNA.D3Y31 product="Coatomer subunit zeta-1" protein_id=Seg1048.16/GoldUCD/D3Y31
MDGILQEASLYTIKGVAILDNDGERILSKYFDDTFPTIKEQREFEKSLYNKTSRQNAEIIMLDGLTIVYRSNVDLYFYVMGSSYENELILASVLNALYDAVSQMLKKNVEKRFLMDHLDAVLLALDELVDGGVILEADSNNIVQRVAMKMEVEVPLSEQTVAQEASLYTIKGVAILDNDGERILSKYFDDTFPTIKEQREFEKSLYNKTSRQNAEIIMLDGLTIVYRSNVDLYFYVMGSSYENELILASVLNALYDSISQMLKKNVEKRFLMDHLDAVLLALDELVDGGVILEADSNNIVQRVAMKMEVEVPLSEQTVAQVIQTAKDQLKWSLLK